MKAKVVVTRHALVEHNGEEFRVWPEGEVECWSYDSKEWMLYFGRNMEEVRAAGLAALGE